MTETGLGDCHEPISTFFKAQSSRTKPKLRYFRNYKKFNKENFLRYLKNE